MTAIDLHALVREVLAPIPLAQRHIRRHVAQNVERALRDALRPYLPEPEAPLDPPTDLELHDEMWP